MLSGIILTIFGLLNLLFKTGIWNSFPNSNEHVDLKIRLVMQLGSWFKQNEMNSFKIAELKGGEKCFF